MYQMLFLFLLSKTIVLFLIDVQKEEPGYPKPAELC